MDLKGRYVYTPFEKINEFGTALACLRTSQRINVYLSEDFVLLVPSGYCQGILKRLRVPLRTQGGTAVIPTRKLYQYLRLLR